MRLNTRGLRDASFRSVEVLASSFVVRAGVFASLGTTLDFFPFDCFVEEREDVVAAVDTEDWRIEAESATFVDEEEELATRRELLDADDAGAFSLSLPFNLVFSFSFPARLDWDLV